VGAGVDAALAATALSYFKAKFRPAGNFLQRKRNGDAEPKSEFHMCRKLRRSPTLVPAVAHLCGGRYNSNWRRFCGKLGRLIL